jgi:hypothetical protein
MPPTRQASLRLNFGASNVMRTVELHFPKEGVNRRLAERREKRGSYPTPWGVNVRLDDNIDRRLRGGVITFRYPTVIRITQGKT